MFRKIISAVSFIATIFIVRRTGQVQLNSDTTFVIPHSYTNNQSPDVISHLEQYCVGDSYSIKNAKDFKLTR